MYIWLIYQVFCILAHYWKPTALHFFSFKVILFLMHLSFSLSFPVLLQKRCSAKELPCTVKELDGLTIYTVPKYNATKCYFFLKHPNVSKTSQDSSSLIRVCFFLTWHMFPMLKPSLGKTLLNILNILQPLLMVYLCTSVHTSAVLSAQVSPNVKYGTMQYDYLDGAQSHKVLQTLFLCPSSQVEIPSALFVSTP